MAALAIISILAGSFAFERRVWDACEHIEDTTGRDMSTTQLVLIALNAVTTIALAVTAGLLLGR